MSICKNCVNGSCSVIQSIDCDNSLCCDYNELAMKVVKYINQNFVNPDDLSSIDENRDFLDKEDLLKEYFDGENMDKKLFDAIIEKLEYASYTKSPFID